MNKILEPEFIDVQKTRVRFKIQAESGSISVAELNVPPNMERGVNGYWDRIMDEFDIDRMRRIRNEKELRERKIKQAEEKRRLAGEENRRLKSLFEKKMKAFELPYIENAPAEIKAAIRRAPNEVILDAFMQDIMLSFMKENNMSYVDYLDYLEELEDKKALETNTTT